MEYLREGSGVRSAGLALEGTTSGSWSSGGTCAMAMVHQLEGHVDQETSGCV